jgi:hypothetical protein
MRGVLGRLALSLLLVACATAPDPAVLRGMEEATLVFPGGEVLGQWEFRGTMTIEGETHTRYGLEVGVAADEPAVMSFYQTELTRRGWVTPDDVLGRSFGIITSSEATAESWRKGAVVFRLAIKVREGMNAPPPELRDRYATIYRIDLYHADPEDD